MSHQDRLLDTVPDLSTTIPTTLTFRQLQLRRLRQDQLLDPVPDLSTTIPNTSTFRHRQADRQTIFPD